MNARQVAEGVWGPKLDDGTPMGLDEYGNGTVSCTFVDYVHNFKVGLPKNNNGVVWSFDAWKGRKGLPVVQIPGLWFQEDNGKNAETIKCGPLFSLLNERYLNESEQKEEDLRKAKEAKFTEQQKAKRKEVPEEVKPEDMAAKLQRPAKKPRKGGKKSAEEDCAVESEPDIPDVEA